MAKMWRLYDFKAPLVFNGKSYMSMRMQNEYDCQGERTRTLSLFFHKGNMASGEVVYTTSNPENWEPNSPGTLIQTQWEVACGKLSPPLISAGAV